MRAFLDANILISYLLHNSPSSPITAIVRAGIRGEFTILLAEALLAEFETRISGKEYLRERISVEELQRLAATLRQTSEIIPLLNRIPAVTRDPKDDYLLAYAVVGQADYIVTGDDDLLILKEVEGVKMVTVREFCEILDRVNAQGGLIR